MSIQHDGGSTIPPWTMGDRLRKARETRGLGQREFAELIGVSKGTVTSAETGRRAVRDITINAWAMASGLPREWLRDGIDPDTGGTGPRPDGPDGDPTCPRGDSNTRRTVYNSDAWPLQIAS